MNRINLTLMSMLFFLSQPLATAGELDFREQELPTRLQVGYAVRLLDMNDDQRPDIVIVDSKRILWLENPNWTEHTLTSRDHKFDNVCFAPQDINGDGRLDFAVGADWQFTNTAGGGTIGWITGTSPYEPWTYHPIGQEPTTHRMQFADLDGDGQGELIVVPLKGRKTTAPEFNESGVRILSFQVPDDPVQGPWKEEVINDQLHVTHNFWPTDLNRDGQLDLLVASFEGVTLLERNEAGRWQSTLIGKGHQESPFPQRGASEVKHGQLSDGEYIATIEPWHGHQVVVYTPPREQQSAGQLWKRHVLDEDLKWGHAVWCANLDADEDEELIVGVRDDKNQQWRRGLRIYDPQDASAGEWKRYIFDPGSVAIEDLAAADLNSDGRIDIVAVGRQTHNVKIYWNETQ